MEDERTREYVERLLALGDTMLCVDSRHPDVRVPAAHRNKGDLRLVINLGFRHPIHVLPDGVQADLLFGGALHHCWIPYEALWGAYNPQTGEGTIWPARTPPELRPLLAPRPEPGVRPVRPEGKPSRKEPASRGTHEGRPAASKAGSASPRGKGPGLRVIPGGKDKPASS